MKRSGPPFASFNYMECLNCTTTAWHLLLAHDAWTNSGFFPVDRAVERLGHLGPSQHGGVAFGVAREHGKCKARGRPSGLRLAPARRLVVSDVRREHDDSCAVDPADVGGEPTPRAPTSDSPRANLQLPAVCPRDTISRIERAEREPRLSKDTPIRATLAGENAPGLRNSCATPY